MRRVFWIIPLLILAGLIGLRIGQKGAAASGPGGPGGGPGGAAGGGARGGGAGGGRSGGGGRGAAVEAAVAGPRNMVTQVEAVGTAVSPQTVKLSPQSSGRITYLTAREGDRVHAGDVLVRIDPSQVEGSVLQGIAGVSEAQARLAQAEATVGASDVAVESAIRNERAALASAQAKLVQARRTQSAQIAAAQAVVTQQTEAARSAQTGVASAEAQEEAAQANLNAAQVRYERTNNLFKQGFIAAQDVDDARAQAESARGQVRVAQQAGAAARAEVARANAQRAAAQAQVVVTQRETQGAIATAQADVRSANAGLESALANRAQKPANRRNLEALQASVRAAQGQLSQSTAQRANTILKTPIDGTITDRSADPGTLAQPGTPVLTVEVLKHMFVESSFPVELSTQVHPGATATVTFDALPGRTYVGRIADLNRAADPQSRQFTVRVLLDNQDEAVRPGMFGHVVVVTSRHAVSVAVPLNALNQDETGAATVTVLDEKNVAKNVEVKVGERDQENAEILSGISAGERVVTVKQDAIRDGQKVTVADPNAAPRSGGGRGQGRGQGRGK